MPLLAKQTGDYRSAGWGGQIINHNYLQLIHFQAVQNKQPGPLEELTVSLQVACGSFGNDLNTQGDKRRGGESAWVMVGLRAPLPPDWRGGGVKTCMVAWLLVTCWHQRCFCFVSPHHIPHPPPFHVPRWCSFWPPLFCTLLSASTSHSLYACRRFPTLFLLSCMHGLNVYPYNCVTTHDCSHFCSFSFICSNYHLCYIFRYTEKIFSCCCLGSKIFN